MNFSDGFVKEGGVPSLMRLIGLIGVKVPSPGPRHEHVHSDQCRQVKDASPVL